MLLITPERVVRWKTRGMSYTLKVSQRQVSGTLGAEIGNRKTKHVGDIL